MAEQSRSELPFWECVSQDLARLAEGRRGFAWGVYSYFADCGFKAIFLHRVAHLLYKHGHRRLANLLTAQAIARTGAEIKPAATIGPGLEIKHSVGIVIGSGVVIGKGCTLLHGVTLGEKYSLNDSHLYPILGDNVTICAGAAVLGDINIGDAALVGAHAVVIRDVPAGARAVGAPAVCLQVDKSAPDHSRMRGNGDSWDAEQEFRGLTLG